MKNVVAVAFISFVCAICSDYTPGGAVQAWLQAAAFFLGMVAATMLLSIGIERVTKGL